ncbi:MAG: glycosyltransferase [Rhodopila sp.]
MTGRIVFLNNQGLASFGGGVTILRHLVSDLARDHAVTVASYDPPAPGWEAVYQVTLPPAPPAGRLWRLAPMLRARHLLRVGPHETIEAADLVVALDCHFALLLRRARPRRLIYLSLSCIPRQEWFGGSGLLAFPQNVWLERSVAAAAGTVMVSSAIHAAELRRFSVLPSVRPAVMHPVFPAEGPVGTATRADVPIILAAGRLEPVKNFAAIIAIAERLRDLPCRFVILGDGPLAADLRARVSAAHLQDRVCFAGSVGDIRSALAGASLFLHPSRYESFGMAVFEAMLAGVPPIIARDAPIGCGEILQDGVNGCRADYGSPDAAAAAIRALLMDAGRRTAMGQAARAAAERALAGDYVGTFRRMATGLLAGEARRSGSVG